MIRQAFVSTYIQTNASNRPDLGLGQRREQAVDGGRLSGGRPGVQHRGAAVDVDLDIFSLADRGADVDRDVDRLSKENLVLTLRNETYKAWK